MNNEFYPDLGLLEEDSLEAFDISLFMDESLLPSIETYEFQLYHINYLRQTWGDSLPFLYLFRFLPPWVIGEVIIGFDSTTADSIRSGQYQGISSLPDSLQPDSFEIPDRLGITVFRYDEKYHPIRLSEMLADLPGIDFVESNVVGFIGWGTYPILPGMIGEDAAYIIVEAPSSSPVDHYFRYKKGNPEYYGMVKLITDSLIQAEIETVRTQFKERSGLIW
ncbi:MAG: hypothetical protein KAU06_04570 [Candidatus Marinimicrobia bacterium]|nr:hypothetical protein [Candidatus Neomarinimicrobiota bacterium]